MNGPRVSQDQADSEKHRFSFDPYLYSSLPFKSVAHYGPTANTFRLYG